MSTYKFTVLSVSDKHTVMMFLPSDPKVVYPVAVFHDKYRADEYCDLQEKREEKTCDQLIADISFLRTMIISASDMNRIRNDIIEALDVILGKKTNVQSDMMPVERLMRDIEQEDTVCETEVSLSKNQSNVYEFFTNLFIPGQDAQISLSEIEKSTGISSGSVSSAIKALVQKGLLEVIDEGDFEKAKTYRVV